VPAGIEVAVVDAGGRPAEGWASAAGLSNTAAPVAARTAAAAARRMRRVERWWDIPVSVPEPVPLTPSRRLTAWPDP
jgi:hypothetical protein